MAGQPDTTPPDDSDCGVSSDLFEDGVMPVVDPEMALSGFPYARGMRWWQRVFIMEFDGDCESTCEKAGIKYKCLREWIRRDDPEAMRFRYALFQRKLELKRPEIIAPSDERKAELTEIMRDLSMDPAVRLKAIEMLCKLDGEFVSKQEITGAGGGPLIVETGVPEPEDDGVVDVVARQVEDDGDDDRDPEYADLDPDEEDA